MDGRVLVVGAGDTAMDVAAVARRIGQVSTKDKKDRPESVILGHTVHDVATAARRQGADVWIVYRRPIDRAPATRQELDAVIKEGVEIHESLAPVEVIRDADGRATALKVVPVDWEGGEMTARECEEFEIECSLIVGATGQGGDFTGFEELDNGNGLMNADANYRVPDRPGHFVGGDVILPHLLTTAIGQASIAVEGIDQYLRGEDLGKRPKVDVHHFNLLAELRAHELEPSTYDQGETRGTDESDFAVHNYENRSFREIIEHDKMFLGHFEYVPMNRREEVNLDAKKVLGNFEERFAGLTEEQAVAEANRCMCCGMCLECNNCIIFCPQDAVFKVGKDERTAGRYVDTDYGKCIGCHICADVCPSGYIEMGLGE
jgi:Pyruvate/2-oxoacid:ferredoxin oxidoreductase delta subunit